MLSKTVGTLKSLCNKRVSEVSSLAFTDSNWFIKGLLHRSIRLCPRTNMDKATEAMLKLQLITGYAEGKHKVSLLMEIGKKMGYEPVFNIDEHPKSLIRMYKVFVCTVKLNNFETEAEGCSKKEAKTKAAAQLLKQIEDVVSNGEDLSAANTSKIPSQGWTPERSISTNTVGKLQELVNELRFGKPVYTETGEEGQDHEKEFVIQVRIPRQDMLTEGRGKTKKEAKKIAAAKMLKLLDNRKAQSVLEGNGESAESSPSTQNLRKFFLSDINADDEEMIDLTEIDLDLNKSGLLRNTPDMNAVRTLEEIANEKGIRLKYFDLDKHGDEIDMCLVKMFAKPPIVCPGTGTSRDIAHAAAAQYMLQYIVIMEKAGKNIINKE